MESDSLNAISWVTSRNVGLCQFHFHFMEIKFLARSSQISFKHASRSANEMADALANQEFDRESPFDAFI